MRSVCLLLILANVLFFVWAQLLDVRPNELDREPVPGAVQPARIVLAREANPNLPARVPEAAPAPAAQIEPDAFACTSVGPFPDAATAAEAGKTLQSQGFEPRSRTEEGEVWIGYWVNVPGLASRDVAVAARKSLNDRGVTDVDVLPGTEPPYTLSLGVYADQRRAQRRADEARALALQPQIEDRVRTGQVHWIDINTRSNQRVDTATLQGGQGRITRLELRGCPSTAPQP